MGFGSWTSFAGVLIATCAAGAQTLHLPHDELGDVNFAGYIYYNASTGDRVDFPYSPRQGSAIWRNIDRANNGSQAYMYDGVSRADGRLQYGSMLLNWGDTVFNTIVDAVGFAYTVSGNTFGPNAPQGDYRMPGLSLQLRFYDGDNGFNDPSVFKKIIQLDNINGFVPATGQNTWIVIVDLPGQEFFLGDRLQSGSGVDEDGDGRADFGFSYRFVQGQAIARRAPMGPVLVLPGNAGGNGSPPSLGVFDGFDWYNTVDAQSGAKLNYFNTLDLGGFPYASFYLDLYGIQLGACPADFNTDGSLDFFDYSDYVECFEGGTCPLGRTADFNRDGSVDFFDYSDYVSAFEQGCG